MRFWLLYFFSSILYAAQPKIVVWQSNAVPVWFVKTDSLPMLDLEFIFDAGSVREAKLPGLSALTNDLIFAGCANKSESEVANVFEDHGAQFSSINSYDAASVKLRVLSSKQYLEPVLQQFVECLHKPNFEVSAIDRTKKQHASMWREKQKQSLSLAIGSFKKQYYGDHAYARYNIAGPDDLRRIKRADIRNFFHMNYSRRNGHLLLVGNIDESYAREISDRLTKALVVGKLRADLSDVLPKKVFEKKLNLPDQVQETVVISQPGIKYSSNSALYKLLNIPLSQGSLSSRMYKKLREEKGYVYSINTMFSIRKYAGEFYIYFQSRPEVAHAAAESAKLIFRDYLAHGPNKSELDYAKQLMLNSIYRRRVTSTGLLSELSDLIYNGGSINDFYNLESLIQQATLAQLNVLAKDLLEKNNPIMISVQNAKS